MRPAPGRLGADGPAPPRRRKRWTRRLGALALAALAQASLLWLTAIQQRATPFPVAGTPATPVWIVRPPVLAPSRSTKVASASPLASPRPVTGPPTPSSPEVPAPPEPAAGPGAAGLAAPGPSAPGLPSGVASALRGSVVGCANAAALGLSDTERAGCRDRLAAGAALAPLRSGIPTDKRAYYDTIVATEAAYRSDAGGAHGPGVFCYPGGHGARPLPHAIKIGPCYIEPPQGMLSVDVDVPEVVSQRDRQPPPR